jgi:hypothetical protein
LLGQPGGVSRLSSQARRDERVSREGGVGRPRGRRSA